MDHTKQFEGGAINFMSSDISWLNRGAWCIRRGQGTDFTPGWSKPKTILDLFKRVSDGKCMEHNLVVYPGTFTHQQMTVADQY